ncbi:DoxX family membrane protein [Terrilactibacillus sp. BCM23-1]|uniref:DoxX family membrane protein n=1 Tax=Terrilactibacillus tamarindi TaxID=2599694 RepID=A0A6N8CQ65_9BACI|nr:DoxX family protein [Terrilactibacillus tamarindi]MTT31808.1 DoxX family membrane protein [Terrilactibacillus tamarindi]
MTYLSIFLQIILGIMFTFLGFSALAGAKKALENFDHLKLPNWFRYLTGLVQLIGALSMIVGIWIPVLAAFGGLWLLITMIVAAALHFRVKQPLSSTVPAIVVGILSLIVFLIIVEVPGTAH